MNCEAYSLHLSRIPYLVLGWKVNNTDKIKLQDTTSVLVCLLHAF